MNHEPEANVEAPETVTEENPQSGNDNQCESEEHKESESDPTTDTEQPEEEPSPQPGEGVDPQTENDPERSFRESFDPKFMNKYICDCLTDGFDDSQLRVFCGKWFEDWYNKLNQQSLDFDTIIVGLIKHCKQHNTFDRLWNYIREERENQYNKYYPKWKEVAKKNADSDRLG